MSAGACMCENLNIEYRSDHEFYFQMSDGKGRLACCVSLSSSTREEAEIQFQQNSSAIIQLARDYIANAWTGDLPVRITFP